MIFIFAEKLKLLITKMSQNDSTEINDLFEQIKADESLIIKPENINNFDLVNKFIQSGCNINVSDNESGITPIHSAVINNNYKIAKLLLEHGADPNIDNGNCDFPIHSAVSDSNYDMIELLLKHGADINSPDIYSDSALDQVVIDKQDEKMIKYLLDHGALIMNCHSMNYGVSNSLNEAKEHKMSQEIIKLIEKRCIEQTKDIFEAIINDDIEKMREYKEKIGYNAIEELIDNHGDTVYHIAAKYGKSDIIKLLLDKPPHSILCCDDENMNEMTPIEVAILSEHLDCAELLFDYSDHAKAIYDFEDTNNLQDLINAVHLRHSSN